jgi:hypothetical protein
VALNPALAVMGVLTIALALSGPAMPNSGWQVEMTASIEVTEIDLSSDRGRRLATETGVLFAPGILQEDRPFGYGRLSERKLRRTLNKQHGRIRSGSA